MLDTVMSACESWIVFRSSRQLRLARYKVVGAPSLAHRFAEKKPPVDVTAKQHPPNGTRRATGPTRLGKEHLPPDNRKTGNCRGPDPADAIVLAMTSSAQLCL